MSNKVAKIEIPTEEKVGFEMKVKEVKETPRIVKMNASVNLTSQRGEVKELLRVEKLKVNANPTNQRDDVKEMLTIENVKTTGKSVNIKVRGLNEKKFAKIVTDFGNKCLMISEGTNYTFQYTMPESKRAETISILLDILSRMGRSRYYIPPQQAFKFWDMLDIYVANLKSSLPPIRSEDRWFLLWSHQVSIFLKNKYWKHVCSSRSESPDLCKCSQSDRCDSLTGAWSDEEHYAYMMCQIIVGQHIKALQYYKDTTRLPKKSFIRGWIDETTDNLIQARDLKRRMNIAMGLTSS